MALLTAAKEAAYTLQPLEKRKKIEEPEAEPMELGPASKEPEQPVTLEDLEGLEFLPHVLPPKPKVHMKILP